MKLPDYKPEFENELELKTRFARELLRDPNEPYRVASKIFTENPMVCSWVASNWTTDLEVQKIQEGLIDEFGVDYFLPSKKDVLLSIWERTKRALGDDDYARLMRLFCDVRGFIEKPGVNVHTNIQVAAPVMLMPAAMTDDQWEQGLMQQQKALTVDSKNTIN